MLNKMQKKGVMEIAVLAGTTIFIYTLILLTIQSATGHKSWLLSSALSLVVMAMIFMVIEKSRLKNHEKFVH
ncbi:MAG: hypothetical protein AABX33_02035 [Nanoarchaeota archaeon]